MKPAAPRRKQADRRSETIGKLLAAATDALIEVGYSGASVQEVCRRAGVSQGGLFRHFATREELMVAVAAEVGRSILTRYAAKFAKQRASQDPVRLALKLLREACRSRPNEAWYELALAARTNARLRRAIAPLATSYYGAIRELARTLLPGHAAALGGSFDALVDTMVAVFDGEQMQRFLEHGLEHDEARIELLRGFLDRPA